MDSNPQGGVVSLLRMARTQCGVAVAFAALRKPDGTFALATFPGAMVDSPFDIEAIDELVHQTWADPHLSGGRVLVRSARLPGAKWLGQNHQTKLAVAPLSDLASSDRPWGLLCVAEPTAGQFEQEHLDLLGTLAVRLTSYLRARQEVVENVFTVVGADEPRDAASGGEPADEPAQGETGVGGLPTDRNGATRGEAAWAGPPEPAPAPAAAAPDERTDVGPSVPAIEWYRGSTAGPIDGTTGGARSVAGGPEGWLTGRQASGGQAVQPGGGAGEGAATFRRSDIEGGEALGTMLRPDPLTGLAGLPSVLVHLGGAVANLQGSVAGSVAVVLVDVAEPGPEHGPLPDSVFSAIADRLLGHVRSSDLVGRIGRGTFAVVANVRTGALDGRIIERRLADAARNVLQGAPGASLRSAVATAVADTTTGAEELLRHAISQLGAT